MFYSPDGVKQILYHVVFFINALSNYILLTKTNYLLCLYLESSMPRCAHFFWIASFFTNLTYLCLYNRGIYTIGVGERKTPRALQNAYNEFWFSIEEIIQIFIIFLMNLVKSTY